MAEKSVGGITGASSFIKDAEKYNEAALLGNHCTAGLRQTDQGWVGFGMDRAGARWITPYFPALPMQSTGRYGGLTLQSSSRHP